jgi:ferredoxin-NADP reductase/ferredoxin
MIRNVVSRPDTCIGCGRCEVTCHGVFRLTYKAHAEAVGRDYEKHRKQLLAAYYGCPVQAIEIDCDDPGLQVAWLSTTLESKTMLSSTVMAVRLRCGPLDFKPGQYVTVRFKDDIGYFNRAYSIVDVRDEVVTVCVTLVKGGRGSSFFVNYDVGTRVEISVPKGEFVLMSPDRPKVFVGTGTGLAPLLSMMESSPNARKTLLFGQRRASELYYQERLARIPNLTIHTCLSRPEADSGWTGLRGRVTDHLDKCVLTRDTEVYTCGNDEMMDDVQAWLRKQRHPRRLFARESFRVLAGPGISVAGLRWRLGVRRVHVYASLLASLLLLFFGASGFVASRPEMFGGSEPRPAVAASHELPAWQAALPSLDLVRSLARGHPGRLNPSSLEESGGRLVFTVESVWATTTIEADRAQKRYTVRQEAVHWATALVQIHRGAMCGRWQRLAMDAAALALVLSALTGLIMGLQGRDPRSRLAAWIAVGASVALTVWLFVHR